MLEWKVELTDCWPACWYGGPYWNGRRLSNQTCYFHRSREAAEAFCKRMANSHKATA